HEASARGARCQTPLGIVVLGETACTGCLTPEWKKNTLTRRLLSSMVAAVSCRCQTPLGTAVRDETTRTGCLTPARCGGGPPPSGRIVLVPDAFGQHHPMVSLARRHHGEAVLLRRHHHVKKIRPVMRQAFRQRLVQPRRVVDPRRAPAERA